MQYFPPALEALVEQFAKLPGIGPKSAIRLAYKVIEMPEEETSGTSSSAASSSSVTE